MTYSTPAAPATDSGHAAHPVVFFPFTCLPAGTAQALRACFVRLTLIRPTSETCECDAPRAEADWLDRRSPGGVNEKQLQGLIREYRAWAEVHRGRRGIDGGRVGARLPATEEGAPSRIRDAIRRVGRDAGQGDAAAGLVNDLVFLSIAETYDLQSSGLQERYEDLAHREAKLFDALRGDEVEAPRVIPGAALAAGDPGAYMPQERLGAWARVACRIFADGFATPILVTTSRAVVESLRERLEGLHVVARLEGIGCSPADEPAMGPWRERLAEYLADLAAPQPRTADPAPPAPPPSAGEAPVRLTLYLATGVDGHRLLDTFAAEHQALPPADAGERTVIALVETEGT